VTNGTRSNSGSDLRILVVGAGIAGLGAARALRQSGFAPDVVERESAWAPTGAGIYLPGNTARALRALGLESAVIERAALIPHQRMCDQRGNLLTDIDVATMWRDVGPCLALHRSDLHEVLAFHGDPVPVRFGVSPRTFRQRNGTVTVEFGDGSTGHYDLVLGADGIHSQVRQLVVGAGVVRPVGQLAWRFVTECPPAVTTWTVLFGHRVSFLAVPIGQGKVYCYCDALPNNAHWQEVDDVTGQLIRLLAGFTGPVPAILNMLRRNDTVYVAPIEEVILDEWSRGSVLLIGDAAHATSPNMAQGAAMALEDALVLAECLASGRGIADALATFEARRRPRTQWVLAQTHRRDRTRNLPSALRSPVLRRWGRNIFHANYRPLLDLP
jgi:2-polyprenyl-6-methoxyphenol hydroxylase-like FAD-dependent oxidoreductase